MRRVVFLAGGACIGVFLAHAYGGWAGLLLAGIAIIWIGVNIR